LLFRLHLEFQVELLYCDMQNKTHGAPETKKKEKGMNYELPHKPNQQIQRDLKFTPLHQACPGNLYQVVSSTSLQSNFVCCQYAIKPH
jgi:hypothetical protein